MGNSPDDMKRYRTRIMAVTGVTDPAAFGIAPDERHRRSGGPHCGKADLVAIGKYHPPATSHVGSDAEDYSARSLRDRQGLTESSSAIDQTLDWKRGGRAAALRNNVLLLQRLRVGDPALSTIKGVNLSADGTVAGRRRYVRENGWKAESSGDNTEIHTHIERYRDTEGTAAWQATADRLIQIAEAAVNGTASIEEDEPMANTWTQPLTQGTSGYAGQQRDTALAFAWQASSEAAAGVVKLLAAAEADKVRDEAALAAIKALATAGGVEVAPVVNAVNAVRDEARQKFAELITAVAAQTARADAAEAERDELERKLAEAYTAASAQ